MPLDESEIKKLAEKHGKILVMDRSYYSYCYWVEGENLQRALEYLDKNAQRFVKCFFPKVDRLNVYKVGPEEEKVLGALESISSRLYEPDFSILQYNSEFAWLEPYYLQELLLRCENTDISAAALALAFNSDTFEKAYTEAMKRAAAAALLSEYIKTHPMRKEREKRLDIHRQLAEKFNCSLIELRDGSSHYYLYTPSQGWSKTYATAGTRRFIEEALELVHTHKASRGKHRVFKANEDELKALSAVVYDLAINNDIAAGGLTAAAEGYKKLQRMLQDPMSDIEFIEFLPGDTNSLNKLAAEMHATGKSWKEAARALLQKDKYFGESWAHAVMHLERRIERLQPLALILSAKGLI